MSDQPTPDSPPRAVMLVAVGLCVASVIGAVGLVAVWGTELGGLPVVLALGLALIAADRFPVYFEFREESVAISLTEVVIGAGFFLVSPVGLIVARLVSVIPIVIGPTAGPMLMKRLFNGGLALFEVVVSVALFRLIAPTTDITRPIVWVAAIVALTVPMLLDAMLLRCVIRLMTHEDSGIGGWTVRMMVAAAGASAVAVLMTGMLMHVQGSAVLLMIGPATLGVFGYRGYVKIRQENSRIRAMYELATSLSATPDLDTVLVDMVSEARQALRSVRAELVVLASGANGDDLLVAVNADGQLTSEQEPDPAHALVQAGSAAGPDGDVLGIPLSMPGQVLGSLVVRGRRANRGPFGEGDHAVLEGVAAQLTSMIARTRLAAQLQTTAEARDYLERHDVLTGLGNRQWFLTQLDELGNGPDGLTVFVLNLRDFRLLNESLGPVAGDRVLVEVAQRLRVTAPIGSLLARLGGDEFAVAIPEMDAWPAVAALVDVVNGPMTVRRKQISLGVYGGVASTPTDVPSVADLMRAADLALASAGRDARTGVVRYERAVEDMARRRAAIAADLQQAIQTGDLAVVYQPLVDLTTEVIIGAEALARWEHPELGFIPPDEFVSVAEETGQVQTITRHVIDLACAQQSVWWATGVDISVSVNMSAHDLEDDAIVGVVTSALRRHGVTPERLILEVTETSMMVDQAQASATLEQLSNLGVGLAIDDFGTGHSSLAYLSSLPVTEVKIDRAFVMDVLTSEPSRLIIGAVVALAAAQQQVVVAEGIEDRATFDALRSMGVGLGQGYFMARPMHGDAIPGVAKLALGSGFPAEAVVN